MTGLTFFGDLPQLDPLPAAGGNHVQALQIRDDRLDIFGDLPQLDPFPAGGSNDAQALQTHDDRLDVFGDLPQLGPVNPLPAVKNCSCTPLPAVGGKTGCRWQEQAEQQPSRTSCRRQEQAETQGVDGAGAQVGEQIDSFSQLAVFARGCLG